jgi:hypothetical protein
MTQYAILLGTLRHGLYANDHGDIDEIWIFNSKKEAQEALDALKRDNPNSFWDEARVVTY